MLIRPVRPEDAGRVQEFVRGLSWRSRFERFFAPIAELSPRQLQRVTSGSGLSLAAFDSGGRIVALAEYAPGEGGAAEFGVVVADAWPDNRAMRLLAGKLGFALRRDEDPTLVRVEAA